MRSFENEFRRYEERMHQHYASQFDGAKLTLQENDRPIMSWPAVSSRPGTQGPKYQILSRLWSATTGSYQAKVSEMQRYEDVGLADRVALLQGAQVEMSMGGLCCQYRESTRVTRRLEHFCPN